MSSAAFDKITKAKFRLVHKSPFFATIALSVPFVEADWLQPPTMATDMERIYYHPQFVEDHSLQQIEGVICHEVMHIVWMHGTRRNGRDPLVWNFAGDYAINPTILDAGFQLPPEGLYNEKYRNWTAPAIYNDLMKNPPPELAQYVLPKFGEQGGDGTGKVLPGSIFDPSSKPGEEGDQPSGGKQSIDIANLENEIKIKVKSAAEAAKSRGNMPGGLEGLIEAVGKNKVNWNDYIQQWVRGIHPDNYSWTRPNRSMLVNHRVYMPSLESHGAGIGVLSIDTSGSVSDKELVEYITEIVGVIELCNPDKLYIIQHDAIIQKVELWEAGMDFSSLKTKGRGGTCIQPTFKYLEEIEDDISWMICFTDMGIGDYPKAEDAPAYPVLWAATGPDNAPFGTYIAIRDAMDA